MQRGYLIMVQVYVLSVLLDSLIQLKIKVSFLISYINALIGLYFLKRISSKFIYYNNDFRILQMDMSIYFAHNETKFSTIPTCLFSLVSNIHTFIHLISW